jgi:hypothetical protein
VGQFLFPGHHTGIDTSLKLRTFIRKKWCDATRIYRFSVLFSPVKWSLITLCILQMLFNKQRRAPSLYSGVFRDFTQHLLLNSGAGINGAELAGSVATEKQVEGVEVGGNISTIRISRNKGTFEVVEDECVQESLVFQR